MAVLTSLAHRQKYLKDELIKALTAETDIFLKSRVCDIIGELAGDILEASEWPEIIPYTYTIIQVS